MGGCGLCREDAGRFQERSHPEVRIMYRAWMAAVDLDRNGKVGLDRFSDATRSMGYGGDLVALFKSFDKNNRGVVGLEEWSPDAAELVFGFKEHLVKTYGSVKGWIKCL